jgi:hypothetical protein
VCPEVAIRIDDICFFRFLQSKDGYSSAVKPKKHLSLIATVDEELATQGRIHRLKVFNL